MIKAITNLFKSAGIISDMVLAEVEELEAIHQDSIEERRAERILEAKARATKLKASSK